MAINVPNVPPPCIIALPVWLINSIPLNPARKEEKPPKIAPDPKPTRNPIAKPNLILDQQETSLLVR